MTLQKTNMKQKILKSGCQAFNERLKLTTSRRRLPGHLPAVYLCYNGAGSGQLRRSGGKLLDWRFSLLRCVLEYAWGNGLSENPDTGGLLKASSHRDLAFGRVICSRSSLAVKLAREYSKGRSTEA